MAVVLVDLDDTLVPDEAARDEALQTALGHLVEPTAVWAAVRAAWRVSDLATVPELAGVSSWEALWTDLDAVLTDRSARDAGRAFQSRVWQELVPDRRVSAAAADFRRVREELVQPYSWAPDLLAEWAGRYDLWCVTNGSSWLQRRKLELSGLRRYFDQVVISGEVGAVKADNRYCDEVAARLDRGGLRALAVVGDSETSDGVLARMLGVPHVLVVPGERPKIGEALSSGGRSARRSSLFEALRGR